MKFNDKAKDFLSQNRIAIAGASATNPSLPGNAILKTLRDKGYTVFPIHPNAETIEGEKAHASLQDIPAGVDGVFIITNPDAALAVVEDAIVAGVPRVWMHYNPLFGAANSSVSAEAVALCQDNNIMVIDGGCPMMFIDTFHKLMRGVLNITRQLPA